MLAPGSTHSGTQSRIDAIVRRHPERGTVHLLLLTPRAEQVFESQTGGNWSVEGVVRAHPVPALTLWTCPDRDSDSSLDQLRAAGLVLKEV